MIGNELKVYDGLTSRQQLNLFRNLYYNDGNATEYGIIANAINDCFTADVVPKSEYDAVVSAVDNSTKEFLKLHDAYQEQKKEIERLQKALDEYEETSGLKQAKAEVAREIFEEIEFDIANLDFDSGETRAIAIEGVIAELKKKYTEVSE